MKQSEAACNEVGSTGLLYCVACGHADYLAMAILKENRRQIREELMPDELELFDNENRNICK